MNIIGESFAGVATSATRVVELYTPKKKRLFHDPLALRLLPPLWQVLFRFLYLPGLRHLLLSLREQRMPGTLGAILCRTRYLDDVLRGSLEDGLEQLVILGAGFDTRPYRIDGVDQIQVFELDLPGSVRLKQVRLENVLGAVPEHVTLAGIDFNRQPLGDILEAAGFKQERRTLFLWEGVTQYLTGEAVKDTLTFVAGTGSSIAFTYVPLGIIDGTARPDWFEPLLSFARRAGSPFIFGLDPSELESYLADLGLKPIEDVGAEEYQKRYLEPLGRDLSVFDGERVAFVVPVALLAAAGRVTIRRRRSDPHQFPG